MKKLLGIVLLTMSCLGGSPVMGASQQPSRQDEKTFVQWTCPICKFDCMPMEKTKKCLLCGTIWPEVLVEDAKNAEAFNELKVSQEELKHVQPSVLTADTVDGRQHRVNPLSTNAQAPTLVVLANAPVAEAKRAAVEMDDEKKVSKEKLECCLCFEQKSATEMCTLTCRHTYCSGCLNRILDDVINGFDESGKFRCPHADCRKQERELTPQDIVLITPDVKKREKIADIQAYALLAKDPTTRHCPTPDCGGMYCYDGSERFMMTCQKCKKTYCANCRINHSERVKCDEARANQKLNGKDDDKKLEEYLKSNAKHCPQCHAAIEKNGGCLWVHCKCGHGFCYHCFGTDHHVWECARPEKEPLQQEINIAAQQADQKIAVQDVAVAQNAVQVGADGWQIAPQALLQVAPPFPLPAPVVPQPQHWTRLCCGYVGRFLRGVGKAVVWDAPLWFVLRIMAELKMIAKWSTIGVPTLVYALAVIRGAIAAYPTVPLGLIIKYTAAWMGIPLAVVAGLVAVCRRYA